MMPRWKQMLLEAYYMANLPMRAWAARRRAAAGSAPLMILFYHRIADDAATPWTCSNRQFARQMAWLAERFDLVSLFEVQRRIASGENHRPAVAITFDDAYADNVRHALPLLVDRAIPCTYFVSSKIVLSGRPFPHDTAHGKTLAPNTPEQIRFWASQGIDMGAHTRHHVNLAKIVNQDEMYDEVVNAKSELEQIADAPINFFSFPYGQPCDIPADAFALARDAGYAGVCSAYGGYNFPGDDPFHLKRIHGDEELVRLKNWLSVDPRKLRATSRIHLAKADRPQAAGVCS